MLPFLMMMFLTREDEGRENKNDDREAMRCEGMGLEESASVALMHRVPYSSQKQVKSHYRLLVYYTYGTIS